MLTLWLIWMSRIIGIEKFSGADDGRSTSHMQKTNSWTSVVLITKYCRKKGKSYLKDSLCTIYTHTGL